MFSRSGIAVLIVLAAAALPAVAAVSSDGLPPADSVGGWRMRGPVRTYSPQNLYEYIDGNADLFLSYGFSDLAAGDYEPIQGMGWVAVDVYNMSTPLQAFGIFGAEKPPEAQPAALGAQGYACDGLVAFWKGRYYVKVALVEGEDREAAGLLAGAAAERISADPTMPVELRRLPTEGRVPGSERYVRRGALGHDFLVEVVSAEYGIEKSKVEGRGSEEPGLEKVTALLHVADLATPGKAAAALAELRDFEVSMEVRPVAIEGVGEGAFAIRDSYYGETVVALAGRFLAIATSEKASRGALVKLSGAGLASALSASTVFTNSAELVCQIGRPCSGLSPAAR